MDIEKLREIIPDAQADVLGRREFEEDALEAKVAVEDLENRLLTINNYFKNVLDEFGDGLDNKYLDISIEVVPKTTNEEEGSENPSGKITVTLNSVTDSKKNYNNQYEVLGYKLAYRFIPVSESGEVEYPTLMHEETTSYKMPSLSIVTGEDKQDENFGIRKFTKSYDRLYSVKELREYTATYLPQRAAQIEELEKSKEMIEAVLSDNELNPWAEETRQLKAQNEADLARHAASVALANSTVEVDADVKVVKIPRSRFKRLKT